MQPLKHYHIYTLLKQAIKAELIEKDKNSRKRKSRLSPRI
jgi:hypothetical protein